MPPVEFDSIPRFASSGVKPSKEALISSNDVLELGAFSPVVTRSKGTPSNEDGSIKDVEVPEVDSEDETTMDKLMKNYSEDESDEDSDYVPSEESDSEDDLDSTENDFMMTRSKGIPPIDSGIVQDVDIPEVDSEDETTMDKLMKDYSDVEVDSDADYVPSEDSDEELEYDSDASISDDEYESELIEDVEIPKFEQKIRHVIINDVKIPPTSKVVIQDVHVGHTEEDAWSQISTIAINVFELVADYPVVKAGINTLDYGLELSEKFISAPYKEHVQNARRHLRAIRRSGTNSSKDGLLVAFIQLFKVNWFLSFIGLSLSVEKSSRLEQSSWSYGAEEEEDSEDDETTVYKLMKEYDSMDDEDYVPVYCEEDSREYEEDSSDDETVLEKVMKEYEEGEDSDYVPSEESEEELEYDSEAEISDSDYDSEELEDCSEDETLLEKIMRSYSEDESDLDGDYVPGEEVEGDIEFDSDASITECSEDEDEESEESSSEVDSDAEEHDIVEEDSQEMDEDSQEVEEYSQESLDEE
jgi:hypothetical protein